MQFHAFIPFARHRLTRCVVTLSVLALVEGSEPKAFAQSVPRRDQPSIDGKLSNGSIRGRVFSTDGRPLRKVQVRVSGGGSKTAANGATTDSDGNYEIGDLSPGRYSLQFSRPGFLTISYGQKYPGELPQEILLGASDKLAGINVVLPRGGVIGGRIVDEIGDPLAGAQAFALQSKYFRGQRKPVLATHGVRTDDTGAFRIAGLLPGDYYVLAVSVEQWPVVRAQKREMMGYVATYFPGRTELAGAQRVRVAVGQEVVIGDIGLFVGHAVSVSGVVLGSKGAPTSASVRLLQEVSGPGFGSMSTIGATTATSDGAWHFREVLPGEYLLRVETTDSSEAEEGAAVRISVSDTDIDGLIINTAKGGTISGTIKVASEAGGRLDVSALRVGVRTRELRFDVPKPADGVVSSHGEFISRAVVGTQRVTVIGLPDGWRVSKMELNGDSIIDRDLTAGPSEHIQRVSIEVSDRVTRLAGTLRDERSKVTATGTVIVFPEDSSLWDEYSRHIRAARPSKDGTFEIVGLPPGKYFASAFDYLPEEDWRDPEVLSEIRVRATRFELAGEELKRLELVVINRNEKK